MWRTVASPCRELFLPESKPFEFLDMTKNSLFLDAWPLKLGLTGCPEMSVTNYQSVLLTCQRSKEYIYTMVEAWSHRSIQSMPFQQNSLRSFLISSQLHLDYPSGLLALSFSTNIQYPFLISAMPATFPLILFYLVWFPNNIWWEVQFLKLFRMLFSPVSFYFFPRYPNIFLNTLFFHVFRLFFP